MTLLTAISNFVSIPMIIRCIKLEENFVGLMLFCSMMASFFYHFTEIYNCNIFLDFSAWHKIDNIFAITGMSIYSLYMTGNLDSTMLIYSTLIVSILAQQRDPWNINYTIGPFIMFFFIGVISNIYYKKGFPKFKYDQLFKGKLLLFVGAYFFVKGLDQHTDYLRLNHGIWHIFLGVASWYNLNAVKRKSDYQFIHHT